MVTIKEINDKVREIAMSSPNYVYPKSHGISISPKCSYGPAAGSYKREPCIFGLAFTALGITLPEDNGDIVEVFRILRLPSDPIEASWALNVQYNQDQGKTWGEAIKIADKRKADSGFYDG